MFFKLRSLPKILILNIKRFIENKYNSEKNPTIVISPSEGIDMSQCKLLLLLPDMSKHFKSNKETKFNLIGNIVHEGKVKEGSYLAHVWHSSSKSWFEIQDLHIKETLEGLVQVSQSYIQFYQRIDIN